MTVGKLTQYKLVYLQWLKSCTQKTGAKNNDDDDVQNTYMYNICETRTILPTHTKQLKNEMKK